ncbi:MAG: T9SS type A sorting domain-containing protein [bacterium]
MKIKYHLAALLAAFVCIPWLMTAQCTPGDEVSCPDPENNGEICPDTLAPVFVNTAYHQEITMLPPSEIDTLNLNFDLHHITLIAVEGLPAGISWVTNAENDEFMAGIYYCILFSGQTTSPPGEYPLKIVVDLYALIAGDPVNIFTLTDSTSLSLEVKEGSSNIREESGLISGVFPNPFHDKLLVRLSEDLNEPVDIHIYDLTGRVVFSRQWNTTGATQDIHLSLQELPSGLYFLSVVQDKRKHSRLISKIE